MVAGLCCLVERQPQNALKCCISMKQVFVVVDKREGEWFPISVFSTDAKARAYISKIEERLGTTLFKDDMDVEVFRLDKEYMGGY